MTLAYLYKWTELSTGKWYIGSRTAKGCHPDDGYICSSKIVKPMILNNPENWKRKILLTCGNATVIRRLETFVLKDLDAASNEISYNMHNADATFTTVGKVMSPETKLKIAKRKRGGTISDAHKEAISRKLTGRKRPEHSAKLKGRYAGDANPSKRPEVREKIRTAALSQSVERSLRMKGDNNPAKRPEVRHKISEQIKTLAATRPKKYTYYCMNTGGIVSSGNTMHELGKITGIGYDSITKYVKIGEVIKTGKYKGFRIWREKND